jgi:hypothetical protein
MAQKISLNELKRLVKQIIKESYEPQWRDSRGSEKGDIYITMEDGTEVPFYFHEDDGEGVSYHASGADGTSTLTFISSDGSMEAKFTAYSKTGNPDDPEYDDLEFVSLKDNFEHKVKDKTFIVDFDKWAEKYNDEHNDKRFYEILNMENELNNPRAKLISINTNGPLSFLMQFQNGKKAYVVAQAVPKLYHFYQNHYSK